MLLLHGFTQGTGWYKFMCELINLTVIMITLSVKLDIFHSTLFFVLKQGFDKGQAVLHLVTDSAHKAVLMMVDPITLSLFSNGLQITQSVNDSCQSVMRIPKETDLPYLVIYLSEFGPQLQQARCPDVQQMLHGPVKLKTRVPVVVGNSAKSIVLVETLELFYDLFSLQMCDPWPPGKVESFHLQLEGSVECLLLIPIRMPAHAFLKVAEQIVNGHCRTDLHRLAVP